MVWLRGRRVENANLGRHSTQAATNLMGPAKWWQSGVAKHWGVGVFGLLLVPRNSEDLGLKEGMNSSGMVDADAAYASLPQHANWHLRKTCVTQSQSNKLAIYLHQGMASHFTCASFTSVSECQKHDLVTKTWTSLSVLRLRCWTRNSWWQFMVWLYGRASAAKWFSSFACTCWTAAALQRSQCEPTWHPGVGSFQENGHEIHGSTFVLWSIRSFSCQRNDNRVLLTPATIRSPGNFATFPGCCRRAATTFPSTDRRTRSYNSNSSSNTISARKQTRIGTKNAFQRRLGYAGWEAPLT